MSLLCHVTVCELVALHRRAQRTLTVASVHRVHRVLQSTTSVSACVPLLDFVAAQPQSQRADSPNRLRFISSDGGSDGSTPIRHGGTSRRRSRRRLQQSSAAPTRLETQSESTVGTAVPSSDDTMSPAAPHFDERRGTEYRRYAAERARDRFVLRPTRRISLLTSCVALAVLLCVLARVSVSSCLPAFHDHFPQRWPSPSRRWWSAAHPTPSR